MIRKIIFTIIFLSVGRFIYAQDRLAVLPLEGSGVDALTRKTVYLLLLSDIREFKVYEVIPESEILQLLADTSCSEPLCAADIGRKVRASKAVYGSLVKLGEKIIFQYSLVDASTGVTLLSDDLTALKVEDLDVVTKRVALSICQQKPVDRTVEVGLVTEQESRESLTRKSNSSWGIGFGYLYPQKGYDNKDRIFAWDFRSLYEIRHVAVDALLGIRQGAALNIAVLYLPSLKDFAPYAGVGVGFHAVAHEDTHDISGTETSNKRGDGFEILLKAGFLGFRTYDFRVLANVEYGITLNDYDDSAVIVTLGVMRSGKKVFGIF